MKRFSNSNPSSTNNSYNINFSELDFVSVNSYKSELNVYTLKSYNNNYHIVSNCLLKVFMKHGINKGMFNEFNHYVERNVRNNANVASIEKDFLLRLKSYDINILMSYIHNNIENIQKKYKSVHNFLNEIKLLCENVFVASMNTFYENNQNYIQNIHYENNFSFYLLDQNSYYNNIRSIIPNMGFAKTNSNFRKFSNPELQPQAYICFENSLFKKTDKGVYPLILPCLKKTDVNRFKNDLFLNSDATYDYISIYVDIEFYTQTFHRSLVINFLKELFLQYEQADIVLFDGKTFANKYMTHSYVKIPKTITKKLEFYKKVALDIYKNKYGNEPSQKEFIDYNKLFQNKLVEIRENVLKKTVELQKTTEAVVISETIPSDLEMLEFLSALSDENDNTERPQATESVNDEDDDWIFEDEEDEETSQEVESGIFPNRDFPVSTLEVQGITQQLENVNTSTTNPLTADDIRIFRTAGEMSAPNGPFSDLFNIRPTDGE